MNINPPSTSGSDSTSIWPGRRTLILGGAAFALVGAGGYLAYRHFAHRGNGGPFVEAESKKADGINAFRVKNYEEAIRLFTEAIAKIPTAADTDEESVKTRLDLMSSCQNNIAACYDALGNAELCLEYCNSAINIKPNYVKALARRAKCHSKLGQGEEAIDDFMDLISMEGVEPAQLQAYQAEVDRVADSMLNPQLNSIIERRAHLPLKIPQTIVHTWLYSTVINDPIVARMAKLDVGKGTIHQGLEAALDALKQNEYDKVVSYASPIITDESCDFLERAQAVLLAARFLFYQGLKEKAEETLKKFMDFWEKLDEAQKLANKDLHVAYISVQLTLIEFAKNGAENEYQIDEAKKQRCYQLVEEALRINPKNVDPLVIFGVQLMEVEQHNEALAIFVKAKKYDPKHPYLRFYEIFTFSLSETQRASMLAAHNRIIHLEHAINDAEKPPIFAYFMLSKSAMIMQNEEMALEAVKKAISQMPNCAYAIYLCGMLDNIPPVPVGNCMQKIERAMRKAIEVDPNYWEPYRILGKLSVDKQDFAEADKFYGQAIELARSRDELMVLLKERLMVKIVHGRIQKGKTLPRGMATA